MPADRFAAWLEALEARHLADLTFPEVSRALRALSSTYVERRGRLQQGAALEGAGKRAAFALFYGPLHFLLVREIVRALPATRPSPIVDLGCGTGAAGAAWATAFDENVGVTGIDTHHWAIEQAAWTYRAFGLGGRARRGDLVSVSWPAPPARIVAAFAINELDATARESMLRRMVERIAAGGHVLVVEPLAGFVAPWWREWADTFAARGGRADEWRFRVGLPPIVAKLDRAAGLNHRELTGRSLFV